MRLQTAFFLFVFASTSVLGNLVQDEDGNCGLNAYWKDCGPACPVDCSNEGQDIACIEVCTPSCVCDDGFLINKQLKICILPDDCPEQGGGPGGDGVSPGGDGDGGDPGGDGGRPGGDGGGPGGDGGGDGGAPGGDGGAPGGDGGAPGGDGGGPGGDGGGPGGDGGGPGGDGGGDGGGPGGDGGGPGGDGGGPGGDGGGPGGDGGGPGGDGGGPGGDGGGPGGDGGGPGGDGGGPGGDGGGPGGDGGGPGGDGGDGQGGGHKCTTGTPALDDEGVEIFCGRGADHQECASGYTCSIHPTDAWAVCCPAGPTTEPTDECGGCKKSEICINTGIQCVTTPCPTHRCVRKPRPDSTCCSPNARAGVNGNPDADNGDTCCSDGTWASNDADGESTCEGDIVGVECTCCTDDDVPDCPLDSSCCSDGSWRCLQEDGSSRCDEAGSECADCDDEEPQCTNGAQCCSDGTWLCKDDDGNSTCGEDGQ